MEYDYITNVRDARPDDERWKDGIGWVRHGRHGAKSYEIIRRKKPTTRDTER